MLFVSKRKNFRIVLKPASHVIDAYGQKVAIPGTTVEFVRGRYETDDPEIIDKLLKNRFRGSQFIVADPDCEVEKWLEEHPQYKHEGPQVITGGISTVNTQNPPPIVAATHSVLRESTKSSPNDMEGYIESKINEKLSPLFDRLNIITSLLEENTQKPKKTFTCPVPGCGQVFRSGMEVGEHKRTAHPEMFAEHESE